MLSDYIGAGWQDILPEHLTWADIERPSPPAWRLDPSVELHPIYERPFFDLTERHYPDLLRWLSPQATLEGLAGLSSPTRRWTDFLLCVPWASEACVLEIDGSQHSRQTSVDRERDRILRSAGVRTIRGTGGASLDRNGLLFSDLEKLSRSRPIRTINSERIATARAVVLGPAALNRFAFGIVTAVASGLLQPGGAWNIALNDPLGVVLPCAGAMLDLLAAVDEVWSAGVVPDTVTVGQGAWHRVDGRYKLQTAETRSPSVALTIVLDPDTPPQAALPEIHGPTIVIRHALLPSELPHVPAKGEERKSLEDTAVPAHALKVLLQDIFGVEDFREGQREAVEKVLRGADSVVMLPTGGGKSLIYQLTGLLRPGLAIIIDPLVSLIDDQVRRMRELGIDRAVGLHAGLTKHISSADVYESIAKGDALFIFLTPERLQVEAFRTALSASARERLVNLAVVDEAHCVSEWGHDFRTAYLRLATNLRALCAGKDRRRPPVLALTGTASPAVLRDICSELGLDAMRPDSVVRPKSFVRPNLHYTIIADDPARRPAHLREALLNLIPKALGTSPSEMCTPGSAGAASGLIFVPHVNGDHGLLAVRNTATALFEKSSGQPDIQIYSGEAPKNGAFGDWGQYKQQVATRFITGEEPLLIATKAFGMGIDKPDVRYTLHLGMPSSIEAFAQESGRAGRDGRYSECVLLASRAPDPFVSQLRDADLTPEKRAQLSELRFKEIGDLSHQLFFLQRSFPDVEVELDTCLTVFEEYADPTGRSRDEWVPRRARDPEGFCVAGSESGREKALYRLSLLGIVEDYTIDYGADAFRVRFGDYNATSLDERFLTQSARIDPNREAKHRKELEAAPARLPDRAAFLLKCLIDKIYRRIEPARRIALDAIYRMATDGLTSEQVSARIASYLDAGPLALAFSKLIFGGKRIDVEAVKFEFAEIPIVDDWEGAASRQLEATPNHPVALFALALGQAWVEKGKAERFRSAMTACLQGLANYGLSGEEAAVLLEFALDELRNKVSGRRAKWCALAWASWPEETFGTMPLIQVEKRAMTAPGVHYAELSIVLKKRLDRLARYTEAFTRAQTSVTNDHVRR